MLRLEGLACGYGGRPVLEGIELTVGEGEVLAVLGPNGAGKTTLLSTLVGLLPVLGGTMSVADVDVTGVDPVALARRHRVAWVPEGRRLFGGMTVMENLSLGSVGAPAADRRERVEEMIEVFPKLDSLRQRDVATLSGGEQQMVAIARALIMQPRVLLLDEPSLGLAPLVVEQIFESLLPRLSDVAVVLVEQNVEVGLQHASHGIVLEGGRIALSASAGELRDAPEVQASYLSSTA